MSKVSNKMEVTIKDKDGNVIKHEVVNSLKRSEIKYKYDIYNLGRIKKFNPESFNHPGIELKLKDPTAPIKCFKCKNHIRCFNKKGTVRDVCRITKSFIYAELIGDCSYYTFGQDKTIHAKHYNEFVSGKWKKDIIKDDKYWEKIGRENSIKSRANQKLNKRAKRKKLRKQLEQQKKDEFSKRLERILDSYDKKNSDNV